MADRAVDRRSHIVIVGTARAEGFTSPSAGGPKFRTKRVNRAAHGGALKRQLGWKKRHRYASHGLRFAVQKPAESVSALRKRINKDAREEDEKVHLIGDPDGWLLGRNLRSKGSLHHDRWAGTASELARREHIAVYPALGWWRERPSLGRSESRARYSLVVSIRTPPTSVDIYQPVAIQLGIAVPTKV